VSQALVLNRDDPMLVFAIIANWMYWVLGIFALSCLVTALLVLLRGKKREGR
jgi:hypothetical protein